MIIIMVILFVYAFCAGFLFNNTLNKSEVKTSGDWFALTVFSLSWPLNPLINFCFKFKERESL